MLTLFLLAMMAGLLLPLTLDMSAAGAATFNDKITATELDISGDVTVDTTTLK